MQCWQFSIFLKVIIYLFEKAKINNLYLVKKKSPNKQSGIVIGHRLVDDTYLFDILEPKFCTEN
jgi:hypothetical protein